jgi:hypothetical protein
MRRYLRAVIEFARTRLGRAPCQGNALAGPALPNVITEWVRQDAATAGAWLNELPACTLRDQAVASYRQVLAAENLDTITDSGLREPRFLRIAEEWMSRNAQATLAWLPNRGLSATSVEQLRAEALDPPRRVRN